MHSAYKKIIIVQTAFIGDVVLTTALIRETKKLFPYSEIDVIVLPQTSHVLENNPYLSRIIKFDKRNERITSFFKTLAHIKRTKYDLALIPHGSFTTTLLVFLGRVKKRYIITKNFWGIWLNKRVLTDRTKHKIVRINRLLSPFTEIIPAIDTELFPSEKDRTIAYKIISLVDPTKLLIAVAPGSVWATKCWPKEYYAELIGYLEEYATFIFIGSKEENSLCQEIIDNSSASCINSAGKTTLLQSAAIIEKCDLIFCNDSGAMHIANAMRTRVISFFGPTVKKFGYYPYHEDDLIIETELECRPCGKHGHHVCPLKHHNCMKLIKPADVLRTVLPIVKSPD
jgi:heptosyltransferase-2